MRANPPTTDIKRKAAATAAHRRHLFGVALKDHPRTCSFCLPHQGKGFRGIKQASLIDIDVSATKRRRIISRLHQQGIDRVGLSKDTGNLVLAASFQPGSFIP